MPTPTPVPPRSAAQVSQPLCCPTNAGAIRSLLTACLKLQTNWSPLIMIHPAKKITLLLALIVAVAGCGKKPAATAPTADTNATTATAAPAPAPAAAAPVVVQNVNQSFTEVDAAVRAKAYDKAVQTLIAVQQQRALTEQQAQQAASRMRSLQADLAAAVAAGDPSARAAAERLRQLHRVQ